MTTTHYGIRTTSTGAWVENCEFGTRAEAEAHLRAQFHREWIEKHEVSERSGTMGEQAKYVVFCGDIYVADPSGEDGVGRMILSDHCGGKKCDDCMTNTLNELNALASRVAAMEEALRKIAATADMKKYRPNELEKCCMPEYALDKEGFADMPIDMLRGLRYNATIAKQALEGAGDTSAAKECP